MPITQQCQILSFNTLERYVGLSWPRLEAALSILNLSFYC